MSQPSSHALRPNRVEQTLRSGVVLYVVLLVAIPLIGLVHFGLADGLALFWERVTAPVARSALWLTMWTALLVGVINTFLGTATAWVLVRYRLPGRSLLSALVDLPLAVPTLVAGVMLAILYGPTSMVGKSLRVWDFEIVFARPGIVLALLFVTLPFVVRAVEPLLAEIDPAEEEAAIVLGAGPLKTFRTVSLPAILPAALSGGIRSLGYVEFGEVDYTVYPLRFRLVHEAAPSSTKYSSQQLGVQPLKAQHFSDVSWAQVPDRLAPFVQLHSLARRSQRPSSSPRTPMASARKGSTRVRCGPRAKAAAGEPGSFVLSP